MKVLFVNTMHSSGGAAIAVRRIMDALSAEGVETRLLLLEPGSNDPRIVPNPRFFARHFPSAKILERVPALAHNRRWQNVRHLEFSPSFLPWDSSEAVNRTDADIVHLNWVNQGHLNPEGIARIARPIVWTAHDMWPMTGGCHHSDDCEAYRERCGRCPVLGSTASNDWSRQLLLRKKESWSGHPLSLVCPSRWLAQRAEKSVLFRGRRIDVIPNPLDLREFSPGSQDAARARLGLPRNVPLILFGANKGVRNPAKGFSFLDAALAMVAERGVQAPHLAIVGADQTQRAQVTASLPVHFLGILAGDGMVDAYRAADVLVLPSVHETLPNMVAEAMACGLPVVAFRVGGLPNMIDHGDNGYLARPFEISSLRDGIAFCLDPSRKGLLVAAARIKAETMYEPRHAARRYLDVYRHALEDRARHGKVPASA